MKVKNAICRRGARKLLLETPEKLLNQEYQEFDIDWSSINAPWIKVDVAGGMFHFMQSQCFVQILPVPEMFSGIKSVLFGTEAERLKKDAIFFLSHAGGPFYEACGRKKSTFFLIR